MTLQQERMRELTDLIDRHTSHDGFNFPDLPGVVLIRYTHTYTRTPLIYQPMVALLAQGSKFGYINGKQYDFSVGQYWSLFLHSPIETEVIEASSENPLLMVVFPIDLTRVASMLVKMEQVGRLPAVKTTKIDGNLQARPLQTDLLEPIVRLLRCLDKPDERALFSDNILDEIYFRVIMADDTGALQYHLQQNGKIQQIAKAIEFMHNNLSSTISIESLSSLVGLSPAAFRRAFKQVTQHPPSQYIKSIKLDRAQILIREGKTAVEACRLVGYNSSTQFSREYKRHFGYSPSNTMAAKW